MKRRRLCCMLLCCLLLTGCTAPQEAAITPRATLSPAQGDVTAPLGDAGLNYETIAALYLPAQDGQQLLTYYETLTLSHSQHPAQTILRALLAHPGNDRVRALGGGVTLALSGTDPVEIAGGVCTVNLTPSALQLTQEDFYTASLAITATLCELSDINYVNVLVAGQPVAMDVSGYLPLGSLTSQTGQELPVLWKQLTARRVAIGELPSATPLTAAVTLYFPLADGTGIVPEVRRLTFEGQHPQQLVMGILDALASGADLLTGVSELPDLNAISLSPPEITELDSGGKRVTLHFVGDLRSRISAVGSDPACCFAALVNTLTTFVPGLQQVCIRLGDGALTSIYSPVHGSLLFPGGLHHRQDYAGYLRAQSTIYAASNTKLSPLTAALPYRSTHDPRTLLLTLASLTGSAAVLPASLADADILGLAITGDTLTIHFSDRFADSIRMSGMDQRLMAYSIVCTMCENLPVRRVQFCFGGASVDTLNADLVWSGEFIYNPGIIAD